MSDTLRKIIVQESRVRVERVLKRARSKNPRAKFHGASDTAKLLEHLLVKSSTHTHPSVRDTRVLPYLDPSCPPAVPFPVVLALFETKRRSRRR